MKTKAVIITDMLQMKYNPARTLRALGLLLADGAPTLGWGKTFWRFGRLFLSDPLCAIPDQKKQCERGA